MKKKILIIIIVLTFLLSCKNNATKSISPTAKKYIDEVITILENNSVNRNKIEWEKFKRKIYSKAKNAIEIEDTYPSIFLAIKEINDKHSYFEPINNANRIDNEKPLPQFKDELIPNDIGYIRISYCLGNEYQNQDYIQAILNKIKKQNHTNIKGWIVDLRDNFGGNMWPMLLSVEPFLGNGKVGYFLNCNGQYESWKLFEGKAYLNDTIIANQENVFQLKNNNPYVAVLINNQTASSGEAISIAFKGRNKTKFFGDTTYGVSTGCKSYTLSDGSRINLAISTFVDRNHIKYGNSIAPDVKCKETETVEKAIEWINLINANNKQIIP
ncbi:MAG: hypothetical protein CMP76_02830 [Flavobacterium sp.]|uniref:S41 family peptidase n=1 Tax=Flavobacterium sp. TaxID=239 RepID=UPI000C357FDF|nr:S41 family peptidase [Flavobacterium sp.]MBF02211.1 hypothetical protein [Flavobacterium sp.]